jgi:glutamate-ammonia-ligase adenylyltransferase
MKTSNWSNALKTAPDPQRAGHYYRLLQTSAPPKALEGITSEQAAIICALFSGSQALSTWIVTHPEVLEITAPEALKFPRRKEGLRKMSSEWFTSAVAQKDYASALRQTRELKQKEMVRIAARDLARLGKTSELIQELSDLADICLDLVWRVCFAQLQERFGLPCHLDPQGRWHATPGCVLGMGKLGGQELNYSSDVDLLFVFSDEGAVFREIPKTTKTTRPALSNHQFFNRLAEAFIGEVTRMAPEGQLYRVDMRLRPEGEGGPLSRSLFSYENYYAQWGQTWERMMLIKARTTAGDAGLGAEFLEMVQPFRYARSLTPHVLHEVAAMKDRIENEVVKAGELDRNVKLGRGGIREIEFVVQALQLLHGGRQPFLQGPQTLPALEKLVQYDLLESADAKALTDAYPFLRDVEHRLQMDENRQTHTIPENRADQERLAKLMGFGTLKQFEKARGSHCGQVRRIFEKLLKQDVNGTCSASRFPGTFEGTDAVWKELLVQHSFQDPDRAYRVLREFVEGPGYVHVSTRTRELALQLLPRLFDRCIRLNHPAPAVRLSDPDRVVTRLDSFITAYGARATMLELWHANPAIFDLLVLLFDRSEFLAELAIRTPDLVDELVTSGRLRQRKTAEETLRDLRHGLKDEDQLLWMRRYHQAELMRIGLRDILGLADPEQYLTELSALADACLEYAVEVVTLRHKLKRPPFVVIGMGKLGGTEIDYGSDLDILFVADQKTKDVAKLSRFALEVMDLVSTRTEQGMLFQTDARLRPDGEKGLVANTLRAYEDYYLNRAALWEIQSLTRSRPAGGDKDTGAKYQAMAARLTNFSSPPAKLSAFSPDWRQVMHRMRMRIEKERTPAGQEDLAIKTGKGGLVDAEFIAQALCLQHGWHEANTLAALERGRSEGKLPQAEKLIPNYRMLRRVEGILRRWSYEGEILLPTDPAPFKRVSIRCGFDTPEQFQSSLAAARQHIRDAYLAFFQPG